MPRSGAGVTLEDCDAEPIHIPGLIQPHGALIAFVPDSGEVLFTSANLTRWLPNAAGIGARATVDEFLGRAALHRFRQALLLDAGEIVRHYVFDLPARMEDGQRVPLEAVLHIHRGVAIVELAPFVAEERHQDWAEMFGDTVDALRHPAEIEPLVQHLARKVKAMTRFDRVMVYQFHADGHGQVVADAHEPDMESFQDLHYPATDIPNQARELYRTNLVRFIADVDYQPVLVGTWPDDNPSSRPLDMSYAMLRSVSPIHVLYLRNMGVRSSLTISLLVDGKLWGLIACHHRTPTLLPLRLRRACSALSAYAGYMVSDSVKRRRVAAAISLMQTQTAIFGLFNQMQVPLNDVVAQSAPALLQLANATGGALWRRGHLMPFGIWPGAALGASIVESVRSALAESTDGLYATERVAVLPGLEPSDTQTVCGAMAVELGASGSAGIVWIRPEFRREVNWGGDPEKSIQIEHDSDGKLHLSPRSSFAQWRTLVEGRCRPWSDMDQEAARAMLPLSQLLLVRESLARIGLFETP